MDIGQGLYVTMMGMGLVFLSLAILLFAMMALDRLFPGEATTQEAPTESTPPSAETVAPASAPVVAASTAAPAAIEAMIQGKRHSVELGEPVGSGRRVVVDGQAFEVESIPQRNGTVVIDGRTYRAEVVEVQPGRVRVRVGDATYDVELPEPEPAPAPAATAVATQPSVEAETVPAPLPGRILRVLVAAGSRVERGQELCVLEAMKMENSIRAPRDGVVREVRVVPGQSVGAGEALLYL